VKFIIGWLHFKPGTRDAFLEKIQPLIEKIRGEEGNIFFELNPRLGQPDTAMLTECFVDDAAHRAHKQFPHMKELFASFDEVLAGGDVKVHFTDELLDDV
jgi:quinol monooxygenase YgiN